MTARQATLLPSVLICVALAVLLFSFTRRFLSGKSKITRICEKEAFFTVLLFFLCGGIGGLTMLRDREFTLDEIINEDWMQKTSSGKELYWFSIVCHILLPQRTATYAYPLVVLIFTCLYTGVNTKEFTYSERKKLFLLAGFLTGLLPLVHAHSFLVVGIVSLSYCLLHPGKMFDLSKNGYFFYWLCFGLPIILLASPQIPNYLDRIISGDSDGSSFIKYSPLWRNHPWIDDEIISFLPFKDLNFFILWWNALTFVLPLSLLGFYFLNVKQRKFFACVFLIFIMANLIMFQPWDKDNTKLFAIWMFLAAAVSVYTLSEIGKKHFIFKFFVCIIFVSMIVSGSLMCVREANLWWMYSDQEDFKVADVIKARTAHDAIFITGPNHINPVTNFAGRTTVFGFPGWVHSHGYPDMWSRQDELRNFLRNPRANSHFLKTYNISYICWDVHLSTDYTFDQDFLDKNPNVLVLYQSYKYKVYDVQALRDQ